jgi:hypothetical protein
MSSKLNQPNLNYASVLKIPARMTSIKKTLVTGTHQNNS